MNKINDRANISNEIVRGLEKYHVPILKTRLGNRTAYAETALDGIRVTEGKDKKPVMNLTNWWMKLKIHS
jgi:hypothetical protein